MVTVAYIFAVVALSLAGIAFSRTFSGHKHQWLPWARQSWNDKPLYFSGAFGHRRCEVSICATCGEVKIRMLQVLPEDMPKEENHEPNRS
jgi:hypothetical protein